MQKQQRTLRLVLRGCGDTPHGRDVSQELLDVPCRKLLRMAIVVELDEAPDPIVICLLRTNAVMHVRRLTPCTRHIRVASLIFTSPAVLFKA